MQPHYPQAHFLLGAARPAQFPPDAGREVAFVGRSNAGKSSALNAITGLGKLARVSKTPGRTREINFFGLDDGERLVDLPGYGYARASKEMQAAWARLIGAYFNGRQCLAGVVLLMDIRHPLTPRDLELFELAARGECPVLALLTKADKLSRGPAHAALRETTAALAENTWIEVGLFSTLSGIGVEAACAWIDARLAGRP